MAWVESDRSTTVAPRNLPRDRIGTVETEFITWRCYSCKRRAVTKDGQPSACCCGAR